MCKEASNIHNQIKRNGRLYPPDIPENTWCDFRQDYESGMTLKQVAEKYMCDPRTVRSCIIANKSSSEIGRQTAPTKLAAFADQIDGLYRNLTAIKANEEPEMPGICDLSRRITEELQKYGYTGGERTVRNYLRKKYQFITRR